MHLLPLPEKEWQGRLRYDNTSRKHQREDQQAFYEYKFHKQQFCYINITVNMCQQYTADTVK